MNATTLTTAHTVADRRRELVEDAMAINTKVDKGDMAPNEGQRAVERIDASLEQLSHWPDDMKLLSLHDAINDDRVPAAMRAVIRWQHVGQLNSDFQTKFWAFASHCDENNLERLAGGWPDEVRGMRMWRSATNYAASVRGLPIAFPI